MQVQRGGRLAGKVVLITGAGRGQGAAEARLCAAEGAAVVLGDVLDEEGSAVAREIVDAGGDARYVHLDISDEADWARAVALAVDEIGGLHGLVNNAAILRTEGIQDTTREIWEQVIAVNQTGPFLGMRAAIPAMRSSSPRGGSIVNVSSVMAWLGGDGGVAAAYAATKGAILALSKSAAMELGPLGIRVNSLHPGAIDTPMSDVGTGPGAPLARRQMEVMSPLDRFGTSEEVAWAALFLLSDEASFVTGSAMVVDGGYSSH
jgi:NAD(P)-dependent dehydrogenase (short-subunit alcohol dehydrogenase family)